MGDSLIDESSGHTSYSKLASSVAIVLDTQSERVVIGRQGGEHDVGDCPRTLDQDWFDKIGKRRYRYRNKYGFKGSRGKKSGRESSSQIFQIDYGRKRLTRHQIMSSYHTIGEHDPGRVPKTTCSTKPPQAKGKKNSSQTWRWLVGRGEAEESELIKLREKEEKDCRDKSGS